MFAMNVQSVSVQRVNRDNISKYTPPTRSFAVVCVAKISDDHKLLNDTFVDVLLPMDLMTVSEHDHEIAFLSRLFGQVECGLRWLLPRSLNQSSMNFLTWLCS